MANTFAKLTCRQAAREPFEKLAKRMGWSHADLSDALIELGTGATDRQLLDALRRVYESRSEEHDAAEAA